MSKKSFAQKAREAGVKIPTAYARRKAGWTEKQALGLAAPPKRKPAKKPADNPKVTMPGDQERFSREPVGYDDLVQDQNRSGAIAAIVLILSVLLVLAAFILKG